TGGLIACLSSLSFGNLYYILRKLRGHDDALALLRKLKLLVRVSAVSEAEIHFVFSLATGHCDRRVFEQTLADTLVWLWRGYYANLAAPNYSGGSRGVHDFPGSPAALGCTRRRPRRLELWGERTNGKPRRAACRQAR